MSPWLMGQGLGVRTTSLGQFRTGGVQSVLVTGWIPTLRGKAGSGEGASWLPRWSPTVLTHESAATEVPEVFPS